MMIFRVIAWFYLVVGFIGNILVEYFPSFLEEDRFSLDTYSICFTMLTCTSLILFAILDYKQEK